jgi:hypothetical protein
VPGQGDFHYNNPKIAMQLLKEKLDENFNVGVSSPKIPNITFKPIVLKLYMDEIERCRRSCEERIWEIRGDMGIELEVWEDELDGYDLVDILRKFLEVNRGLLVN